MPFRLVPLLTSDENLPGTVRLALAEGRMEEAGALLMEVFQLSCEEVSELVDRDLCGG